jgi:hypothetical protein
MLTNANIPGARENKRLGQFNCCFADLAQDSPKAGSVDRSTKSRTEAECLQWVLHVPRLAIELMPELQSA